MLSVHDEMSTMPEGINNINIIIIIYYYYYYCKPCLSHSVAFSVYILKICGKICIENNRNNYAFSFEHRLC